jgi:hypothetical protein
MPLPGKPAVVSSRALQDSNGTLSLLGRVQRKLAYSYKNLFLPGRDDAFTLQTSSGVQQSYS